MASLFIKHLKTAGADPKLPVLCMDLVNRRVDKSS